MVQLQVSNGSLVFTFTNSQHYLNNGTISVPLGSLALIVDNSNMATFRKANSNDIFCSILMSELSQFADKSALASWFAANAMPEYVDEELTQRVDALEDEMISGVSINGSAQTVTNNVVDLSISIDVDSAITSGSSNAVSSSAIYSAITENERVVVEAIEDLSGAISSNTANISIVSGNVNTISGQVSANTANISTVSGDVSANTADISTVSAATAANTTALGGFLIVAISQAAYDALATKDANTIYIINS